MTEKTLTTENIRPALDALRGELAPWPVVAKKQDRLNTAQLNAANSGITSSLVAQIIANTAAIRALESAITGTGLRALVVASLPAVGTTGILYIVPVTTYDPDTDADVVNYSNEYIWIPVEGGTASEGHYEQVGQTGIVINNGQLTITVNGTSVGTFTANQSGDTTAAITVPTNADYVDRTTDQTVAGVKTFSDGIVGNVTGTASKAIADEDGTSIKTGYGKLAGNQTWTGTNTYTGAGAIRFNNSAFVSGTPSANVFYTSLQWGGFVNNTWSAPFTINNAIRTNGYSDTSFRTYSQTSNTLTGFVHETNADASDIAFRPIVSGTHKLGSSSYQWSSVYAQSYYYNGTAWGLDKANTWTGSNTFNSNIKEQLNYTIGETPATDSTKAIQFVSSSGSELINVSGMALASGANIIQIAAGDRFTDGVKSPTGTIKQCGLQIGTRGNGDRFLYTDGAWRNSLIPYHEGNVSLGTSTNKWKTLNGVNPGALSLPDYNSTAKVDISGSIIPDPYGNISYTPPINGWLYVCFNISNATTTDPIFYIQAKDNNVANSSFVQTSWMPTSGTSSLAIFFPVVANKRFIMQINFSNYTIIKAHVIPCLGNV